MIVDILPATKIQPPHSRANVPVLKAEAVTAAVLSFTVVDIK